MHFYKIKFFNENKNSKVCFSFFFKLVILAVEMNYDEHMPLSTIPELVGLSVLSAHRLKVQGKFYSLVYLCKA